MLSASLMNIGINHIFSLDPFRLFKDLAHALLLGKLIKRRSDRVIKDLDLILISLPHFNIFIFTIEFLDIWLIKQFLQFSFVIFLSVILIRRIIKFYCLRIQIHQIINISHSDVIYAFFDLHLQLQHTSSEINWQPLFTQAK